MKLFYYDWQQRLKEFETTLDGAPNDQTALEVSSEDNVYGSYSMSLILDYMKFILFPRNLFAKVTNSELKARQTGLPLLNYL